MAATILFYTLLLAPNRYQILFWKSGLLTYLAPLVLNTWLLGRFFFYRSKSRFSWLGAVELLLTAWLSAGFSETVFAIQTTFWVLILILMIWRHQTKTFWYVVFILIGGAIGAALLLLNPTNAIRQSFFPPPPSVLSVGLTSIRYAFDFFFDYLTSAWLPLFVFTCSGVLVGWLVLRGNEFSWRQFFVFIAGLLLGTLILLTSLMAPTLWAMSAYPDQRGLLSGTYIMNLFLLGWGLGFGAAAAKLFKGLLPSSINIATTLLLALALGAYAIHFVPSIYQLIPVYQERAEIWDLRHAKILQSREQGQSHVIVSGIDSIAGIFELQPDEGHWVNRCAAEYYGLDGIQTTE